MKENKKDLNNKNPIDEQEKEGVMARKRKNKTMWGVIGVILTIFGITGTIPVLLNEEYLLGLPITAVSVIGGIILIAWAFSD